MPTNPCFQCGGELIWQSDFDFDDFGIDGDGIVNVLKCIECDARVEYYISDESEEDFVGLEHCVVKRLQGAEDRQG